MPKREKWTRDDYATMIGLSRKKKKGKKTRSAMRGGARVDDLLLARMIGKRNRNPAQRRAIIDSMSSAQLKGMGRILRTLFNSTYPVPQKTIKQLSRNEAFVKAMMHGQGRPETRKKILTQKGGFLPALLPLAAKIIAPSILGSLAQNLFK